MKIVNVKDMGIAAVENLLKKPAFDQVELNPRIREANKQLFGEDLTAAQIVDRIVGEVRRDGDAAVIKYTKLIDRTEFTPEEFLVTEAEYEAAYEEADPEVVASLKKAAENVRQYHQEQKPNSWMTYRDHGSILGQSVIPLDRVGIYVPGGTAAYPSSVIMNAMPAVVAGVREIIMMVPPKNGKINPYVLVAAKEAGVSKIFKLGGAQAIAAMAVGTESIPRVDVIVGPGNKFVAEAKKLVYGTVGIDMVAGPTEVFIIADSSANPAWVAADLLAQAEHDIVAQPVLATPDENLAKAVAEEIEKQLASLETKETACASINNCGRIIITDSLEQAAEFANRKAPEHLELAMEDSEARQKIQNLVHNYGSLFIGHTAAEVFGDYAAGLNHTLPTSGSARFTGGLSVRCFLKTVTTLRAKNGSEGAVASAKASGFIGDAEGLAAHARAARIRLEQ